MPDETPQEMADALYYELRPRAIAEYNTFFLCRTPPELQEYMKNMLAPDLPKIMVSDGQVVAIKDANGVDVPGSPGTARATDQYSGYIELVQP